MSPIMTSRKSIPIFTSYLWPAVLALFMAFFLSQWAVADPPVQNEARIETGSDETSPMNEDDVIELPAPDEPSVDNEGTLDEVEARTIPALNIAPMATKSEDKCYEQTDGSFECVCEGEAECKTLEAAKYCLAGTHWGKDGYGGCTKKAAD